MARIVVFVNNSAAPWVLDELDGRVVAALSTLDVSSEITDDEMMHAIQSGLGLSFIDDPNGRYLRINGVNKTAIESLNYGNMAEGPDPAAHFLGGADHVADTLANLNSKITDAQLDDDNDPRPPLAHAVTHNGGVDPVTPAGIGAEPAFAKNTAFNKNFGVLAGDVCEGNDARLSDARPPTAHAVDHNGGIDPVTPAGIGAEPAFAKNTAFNKNFGNIAGTVCEGNDARLSDARTPTAHKDTHVSGAGDQFISTDIIEAIVKRLQESGGPTTLAVGAVADGQVLQRSGLNIIGAAVETVSEATLSTVGNAWTTIATIALADNTVYLFEAAFVGRRTDAADRGGYLRKAVVYREAAGVATMQGAEDTPLTRESTGAWDVRINTSGNNVILEVRGGAGASVNWKTRYKITSVA